jgi:hypothetical protein
MSSEVVEPQIKFKYQPWGYFGVPSIKGRQKERGLKEYVLGICAQLGQTGFCSWLRKSFTPLPIASNASFVWG